MITLIAYERVRWMSRILPRTLLLFGGLMFIASVAFGQVGVKDRVSFHLSTGLYEPQDKQGGGFRFGNPILGTGCCGEREVEIDNGVRWEAGVQWGFREGKTAVWALELEGSYFKEGVGAESAFVDPDASTIQQVPDLFGNLLQVGTSGDERQKVFDQGEITLIPVSVNLLWHFGTLRGKTSAYAGLGPGWVFADWDISPEYREFVGYDDGDVDDGPALNLKGGIQVALNENWRFDFHINYLLTDEQFRWQGVDTTFGDQAFDLNGDEIPDLFGQPADRRLVEPGNVRLDGLAFSVGIRYALPPFGKGNKSNGGDS